MRKMTEWLAKLVAAGLLVSFLSIWTTGYIVNSYVETLLRQFNIPIEVQPMALSGVWGKLWGADPVSGHLDSGSTAVNGSGKAEEPGTGGASASGGADGNADGETAAPPEETPSDGKPVDVEEGSASLDPLTGIGGGSGTNAQAEPPESDGVAGEEAGETDGTEVAITTDNMTEMKSQMSAEDKDRLFSLLMTKLPQEAWQSISTYVEDGLTDEELTNVEQIMAQHLNSDEYKQMMEILKKY